MLDLLPQFKDVLDLLSKLTDKAADRQAIRDLKLVHAEVTALQGKYLAGQVTQTKLEIELAQTRPHLTDLEKENAAIRLQLQELHSQKAKTEAENVELKRKLAPGRVETIQRPPRRILM